ncbi:DUF992 domain-containing protein [Labrys monachus]|uniref:DUF992 domain-containing protein n=1 Tax=Labrys monachus TaxID=217067 RepID=A0ABU0FJ66_9HYPH|nr:DUF992 domain-containing protein [Labrys monachus]MDQ0394654.1 hypothetical protein [Labrys monachus]
MSMMKLLPAVALTAMLLPAAASGAQAAVRTGTLTCDVAGGVGMVVMSSKAVSCRFTDFNGNSELYAGDVRKFGVDLGFTNGTRVVWAVFEPAVAPGSLAGSYAGVTAEATAGLGLGANVLVGGGNGGVTLQPLSVQGQTGLNVAAGIGSLEIAPVVTPVVARTVGRVHYRHRHGGWHRHHDRHGYYGPRHHHRHYRHEGRRPHHAMPHHHHRKHRPVK